MSSSQGAQNKGKGKVVEGKRTKASKKRPNLHLEAYKKCVFVQTKWPHKPTLEKLGLLEDVTAVLTNMGLQNVLEMDYLAYPEELAHMMSTFELDIKETYPPLPIEELGCVRFEVKGERYELSIKDLCLAYGFKLVYGGKVRYNRDSDTKAWKWLGYESYKGSRVRSATIRNPTVRYVHRVIAHTMYARKETDKVKEDEFALLMNGLYPIFWKLFEDEGVVSYEGLNLGVMLAKQILYLKNEWVLHQPEKAKVYIGGFLTPILLACKVPLGAPSTSPRNYLDKDNLIRQLFLDGKVLSERCYKFITENGEEGRVVLPNPSITTFIGVNNISENLRFMHGEVEVAPQRKRSRSTQATSNSQELPLGSSRYYQAPFTGKVTTESMRYALDGVEKNHRRGKWLSKSLHNVTKGFKKKMKAVESQLADFKAIVETFVLGKRSPPRNEDGSTSYEVVLEEARRHSISHLPRQATMDQGEASRPSSHEQRRRRHRHIPTPSPPSSENELYHFSDSYSEE